MPAVANVVVTWIHKGTPGNYLLDSWVVIPNHVHLLFTPKIPPSIAPKAEGRFGSRGESTAWLTGKSFWQAMITSVRGEKEFERIENYILQKSSSSGTYSSYAG
jgi:REP element-mobilizing transposase RayT